MRTTRNIAVPALGLTLILLVSLLAAAGSTGAQQGPVWARVDTSSAIPSRVDLVSVFMLDAANAWVGGNEQYTSNGLVYDLKFQNGRWIAAGSNRFFPPVQQVVAISDDNVWVLTSNGLFHKDGATWRDLSGSLHLSQGDYLSTIQMFGAGEGWIGGSRQTAHGGAPLFLHYMGGKWARDESIVTSGSVESLHFAPDGTGYAVGGAFAYRYTGQHWAEMEQPCRQFVPCGYRLNAVRSLGKGDAWAAGYSENVTGGPPSPQVQVVLRLTGDRWEQVLPGQDVVGVPSGRGLGQTILNGLGFSSDGVGLAVGTQTLSFPMGGPLPYIVSYRSDHLWHYENLPYIEGGQLRAVSQADSIHALAVGWNGLVLGYGYGGTEPGPWPTPTPYPTSTPAAGPNPTNRVDDPRDPRFVYFPLVGHTIQGGFRDYWEQHGGLEQFGYPVTEEFRETSPTDGKEYTVQYFERARFEYHPENRPPYDVLLGLLGHTITQGRENESPFKAATGQGPLYFKETGHNMAPQFADYWRTHGGLPVYGYPISEPFNEVSPTDGKTYLVQYFERNRFEYHPELPAAYRVSLGLLGVQVAHSKGWLP